MEIGLDRRSALMLREGGVGPLGGMWHPSEKSGTGGCLYIQQYFVGPIFSKNTQDDNDYDLG